jgi:hypothetical protein
MTYILEVPKCNVELHTSEHIGYMNKRFQTKQDASDYYDSFNPTMRRLNAHKNWCSDWDPTTHLMYIVREHFYESLKISPFL